MPEEKYTTQQVIDALKAAGGFKSQAAVMLGCTHRTINNYIERHPEVQEALDEIECKTHDFVESKIMERISKDDPEMMRFYARTKMRKRGYTERQDIGIEGGVGPLMVNIIPVIPGVNAPEVKAPVLPKPMRVIENGDKKEKKG